MLYKTIYHVYNRAGLNVLTDIQLYAKFMIYSHLVAAYGILGLDPETGLLVLLISSQMKYVTHMHYKVTNFKVTTNQSGTLPFSVALRELPYTVTLFDRAKKTVALVTENY